MKTSAALVKQTRENLITLNVIAVIARVPRRREGGNSRRIARVMRAREGGNSRQVRAARAGGR